MAASITFAGMLLVFSTHFITIDAVVTDSFLYYDEFKGNPYSVTFDDRSFIIDNKRTLLLGGSIHYPRLSIDQWDDILNKMKQDGLNHVEIYVFWNLHEEYYDFSGNHKYDYSGRANITGFLDACMDAGLFVNLRIGPYVCAEWNFGALPTWLLHDEDIVFRWNNPSWKKYMSTFVYEIASVVEPYLAKHGGPIILAQIENEYEGSVEYVEWCGQLAESLNFSIPWVMCNGMSANNTINVCNGNDCYDYAKTHSQKYPGQPLGWTENEGWFQDWNREYNPNEYTRDFGESQNRSPSWLAYTVAIWFAAGGSHHNYYMYYGGNHVSKWAGSGITNYYADAVNYHGDGLPYEPKRTHMKRLHNILANYQRPLLEDNIQVGNEIPLKPIGENIDDILDVTFAYKYQGTSENDILSFLVNNADTDYTLQWNDVNYYVPARSVSIVNNEGIELYNTAKVDATNLPTQRIYQTIYENLTFSSWTEMVPLDNNPQNRTDQPIFNQSPYEQIRFTNNTYSEYLYYSTNFTANTTWMNSNIMLTYNGRMANGYVVYIDGVYCAAPANLEHNAGNVDYHIEFESPIKEGEHTLTILSSNLGIDNYFGVKTGQGPNSQDKKGIINFVYFNDDYDNIMLNLWNNTWFHYIGLTGEILNIPGSGMNNVEWINPANTNNPMTWYKTEFKTPNSTILEGGVILIDIGDIGFRRGHIWLNNNDMGHYNWAKYTNMVQQYYFIPNYYFNYEGNQMNSLMFAEEMPWVEVNKARIVLSTVVIPK